MQDQTGLLDILSITGPIFCTIALGFAAVRLKAISRDGIGGLSAFVVNIALPALLFKAMTEREASELLHINYLVAYTLGSLLVFAIVFAAMRYRSGNSLTGSAVLAMGGSFSNTLMIGYPILLGLFGTAALIPLALTLMVENFLMMPLALAMADIGQNKQKGFIKALLAAFPALLKNPIILAIILGVLFSLLQIKPPMVAVKVIDMLSMTVSGVALFAIGGMLVGIKLRGMVGDISLIVFSKLILHPFAMFCCVLLLPAMDPLLQTSAVILACVPMFSIFAVIASRYGQGTVSAASLVPATVFSFVSISTIIWLLSFFNPFQLF